MTTFTPAILDAFAVRWRDQFFPDSGPFARSLFPRSLEAIRATRDYANVNIFGSNRSSKTLTLAYIFSNWLMAEYPAWWDGWAPIHPVRTWLAGETGELVRDSLQQYLIGTKEREGLDCLIPRDRIHDISYRSKPTGFAERAIIKTANGGLSTVEFKTYDQARERFASATLDAVGLDEEPKGGIFSEARTRCLTTGGRVITAFTSLKGITPLIETIAPEFAGGERLDPKETGRINVIIGWDDIPTSVFSEKDRRELKASYMPHEVIPRTTGVPSIGQGLVYPIPESEFVIPDMEIPDHWPRLFAMDPGFDAPTAISWWAYDSDSDALYQYAEHYVRFMPIAVHADAIHAKGDWMPGVFDYAGGNITDGKQVGKEYRSKVRNPLHNANKSVSMGHLAVWDRLQTGRFFVFQSLRHTRSEFRQYHRDEKGRIADTPHHILDTWRYATLGVQHAKQRPPGFRFNGESMRTEASRNYGYTAEENVATIDGGFWH